MDLIGQTLGQYEIVEQIGAGGMATVYKAYQPNLDRYVAVKVLPAQHALTPGFRERFNREARAVAQLNHPNILPIHDLGIENDLSYFVMQYVVSGHTLRDLQGKPLPLTKVSQLLNQVAGALDHAHDQGILHRDVKPDNILLEGEWVLLADFGLAKITAGGQGITGTGVIIGTPMYVSPEQVKGEAVDHRSDVYSLGVVLYEMVTGRVPFFADSSIGTMFKHVYDPLPAPRQYVPNLPKVVEEVIIKALAKEPKNRFDRAGSLATAFREAITNSDQTDTMIMTPPPSSVSASDTLTEQKQSPGLTSGSKYGEDGQVIVNSDSLHPPLPEFDPRFLEALEAPGGVVKLRDKFYIERYADQQLQREVVKHGTTTTIRASRQTGKSSLLVRGVSHAKKSGARVVTIDLQQMDTDRLTSPDLFLRDFADTIVRKLRLDVSEVDNFWSSSLGPQYKLTYLMEDYVLPEVDGPIVLALDEVDRLLQLPFHTDFFGLLRSWHNSRALEEVWDFLNLVMVISTEPYMLISDVNQSPFNVGLKIYLDDFNEEQMWTLNHRHGSPISEIDFPDWMTLLGGHPYLTRKALFTMVSENVAWSDLTKLAILDHGPFGDHLRRHQWLLRDAAELREAFKQVVEHEKFTDEMALFRLLQAGLVKGSGDSYTCRCDLYRMYFKDKL